MALVEVKEVLNTLDKRKTYNGYRSYLQPWGAPKWWRGIQLYYDISCARWQVEQLVCVICMELRLIVDTLAEAKDREWYPTGGQEVGSIDHYLDNDIPLLIELDTELIALPLTEEMYF